MKRISIGLMQSCVAIAVGALAQTAHAAGPVSSGGGRAVVCRDAAGVETAVLLDIYEGSAAFGDAAYEPNDQDVAGYLELAQARLEKTGYSLLVPDLPSVKAAIGLVQAKFRILPEGTELGEVDDSYHFIVPQNCRVLQAALFVDRETIVASRHIWELLSNRDRAGLILHEAIYWLDRQLTLEQNSQRSRRVVSQALAREWAFEDVHDGLPSSYTLCQTYGSILDNRERPTAFAVFDVRGFDYLQFFALNGEMTLSKSWASTRDFPFIIEGEDMTSTGAGFTTVSLYEDASALRLDRHPLFNGNGDYETSILEIEGNKSAYPQWTMPATQVFCRRIQE
jgi:hypothetical protein